MDNQITAILLNNVAKLLKRKIGKTFEQKDYDSVFEILEKIHGNESYDFVRWMELHETLEDLQNKAVNEE